MIIINIKIRQPKQKRAIEKKEKIIKVGFDLICQKGFYNVNTDMIAKKSGVSTGIIYSYFIDKYDIFLNGISKYGIDVLLPLNNEIKHLDFNDLDNSLMTILNNCISVHKKNKNVHEEISMLSHKDETLGNILLQNDIDMSNNLLDYLVHSNISLTNANEKSHIFIAIIDSVCHEIVFHQHPGLDFENMKLESVKVLKQLLSN